MSHTLLEESKEEVMPEGDLHMLLHFERVFPAKDCASRQGCTVAEYLAKSVCLPAWPPCTTIEQRRLTGSLRLSDLLRGWRWS